MRAQQILEYVLPFIGAAIGGLVLVVQFRELWGRLKLGDVGPLLLLLVSLLCVAYGVERFTYSESIEQRLESIDTSLRKTPGAKFTANTETIWSGISRIMLDVEHNIRTVQAGNRPNLPKTYTSLKDKLADRLNEQKRQHGDVWYRVVLVFDEPKNSAEIAEIKSENDAALQFYADHGLKNNVELRVYTHQPLTKFDVVIVDTLHVNVGFDTFEGPVKGNVEIQNAMLWENQEALAAKLARWFDESVWPKATPYKEWASTQ